MRKRRSGEYDYNFFFVFDEKLKIGKHTHAHTHTRRVLAKMMIFPKNKINDKIKWNKTKERNSETDIDHVI